ncbi:MAG: two-component system, NarL family, sensor histidine kinase DesK, partial [Pseudonocardiales bacterium]|nr:two-component system, NarL family, sensor histidine kinase DesK [Pseudonocardiales bacterium]
MLGWWRSRGSAARFDFFVRATFYASFVAFTPLLITSLAAEVTSGALIAILAAAVIHTLLGFRLVHLGIEHYLGKAPYPRRLMAIYLALACAVLAASAIAYPNPTPGKPDGPAAGIAVLFLVLTITTLSGVLRPRTLVLAAAAGGAFMFLVADPSHVLFVGIMLQLVVFGFRTTLWMLGLVWELDHSREVRANLAVAEERLRFARDLHDVVGRNLSAVALKADLAAQLARRGRSEAIDEMLEVRRIAHDSLEELRAVVSGYRTADLSVELAGARSLLASAGIDCRVIGEVSSDGESAGALGWAVREGVTNVLRHSSASACTITLRGNVLTMSNDGASTTAFRFGSGLTGLRERISALGGSVTAAPEAPNRFVLTVE